jgi:hypothetical protein
MQSRPRKGPFSWLRLQLTLQFGHLLTQGLVFGAQFGHPRLQALNFGGA